MNETKSKMSKTGQDPKTEKESNTIQRPKKSQPRIATILAVISLIISSFVAYWQIGLSHEQNAIQKRLQQPNINVIEALSAKSKTQQLLDQKTVTVSNLGSELSESDIRVATYVLFVLPNESRSIIEIPVSGYYYAIGKTRNPKDVIFRLEGGQNYGKLFKLTDSIRKSTSNPDIEPLDTITYLEIKYKDKFDDIHTDYFVVGQGDNSKKVSADEALPKIDKVLSLRSQGKILIFVSLTAEQILQEVNKYQNR